jgi:heme/copper-type cytochrome/quinol oxidase subunit 1
MHNVIVTAHKPLLQFILIPVLTGGFGNWVVPLILGALKDPHTCLAVIWTNALHYSSFDNYSVDVFRGYERH